MAYRPTIPFTVPMILLTPTYSKVNGVKKKTYTAIEDAIKNDDNIFYGSFKTYGGTERSVNGVYSVEDTANVETWFRPDIKSNCAIALPMAGNAVYEILGEPENIEMRNQYLLFKVQRVKGGA